MAASSRAVAQLASEFLLKAVDVVRDARVARAPAPPGQHKSHNRWVCLAVRCAA